MSASGSLFRKAVKQAASSSSPSDGLYSLKPITLMPVDQYDEGLMYNSVRDEQDRLDSSPFRYEVELSPAVMTLFRNEATDNKALIALLQKSFSAEILLYNGAQCLLYTEGGDAPPYIRGWDPLPLGISSVEGNNVVLLIGRSLPLSSSQLGGAKFRMAICCKPPPPCPPLVSFSESFKVLAKMNVRGSQPKTLVQPRYYQLTGERASVLSTMLGGAVSVRTQLSRDLDKCILVEPAATSRTPQQNAVLSAGLPLTASSTVDPLLMACGASSEGLHQSALSAQVPGPGWIAGILPGARASAAAAAAAGAVSSPGRRGKASKAKAAAGDSSDDDPSSTIMMGGSQPNVATGVALSGSKRGRQSTSNAKGGAGLYIRSGDAAWLSGGSAEDATTGSDDNATGGSSDRSRTGGTPSVALRALATAASSSSSGSSSSSLSNRGPARQAARGRGRAGAGSGGRTASSSAASNSPSAFGMRGGTSSSRGSDGSGSASPGVLPAITAGTGGGGYGYEPIDKSAIGMGASGLSSHMQLGSDDGQGDDYEGEDDDEEAAGAAAKRRRRAAGSRTSNSDGERGPLRPDYEGAEDFYDNSQDDNANGAKAGAVASRVVRGGVGGKGSRPKLKGAAAASRRQRQSRAQEDAAADMQQQLQQQQQQQEMEGQQSGTASPVTPLPDLGIGLRPANEGLLPLANLPTMTPSPGMMPAPMPMPMTMAQQQDQEPSSQEDRVSRVKSDASHVSATTAAYPPLFVPLSIGGAYQAVAMSQLPQAFPAPQQLQLGIGDSPFPPTPFFGGAASSLGATTMDSSNNLQQPQQPNQQLLQQYYQRQQQMMMTVYGGGAGRGGISSGQPIQPMAASGAAGALSPPWLSSGSGASAGGDGFGASPGREGLAGHMDSALMMGGSSSSSSSGGSVGGPFASSQQPVQQPQQPLQPQQYYYHPQLFPLQPFQMQPGAGVGLVGWKDAFPLARSWSSASGFGEVSNPPMQNDQQQQGQSQQQQPQQDRMQEQ